jgi:hypothetical protein
MLEGSITLILADEQEKSPEEVILHAGDVMSFDAYCHHGWRNDENTKALMLFVRRMN